MLLTFCVLIIILPFNQSTILWHSGYWSQNATHIYIYIYIHLFPGPPDTSSPVMHYNSSNLVIPFSSFSTSSFTPYFLELPPCLYTATLLDRLLLTHTHHNHRAGDRYTFRRPLDCFHSTCPILVRPHWGRALTARHA